MTEDATEEVVRAAVVASARRMSASGLSAATSGNVSARFGAGFLVTPSALPYDSLAPADVVYVGTDGAARGTRRPSSEWRIHRDIYAARADAGGVVHAHPPFATSLACHERGIPAFHYGVAAAGGDSIRCAPYATFGTQALSDHVLAALEDRRACLLAHHGIVAVGSRLEVALQLAEEVESLAQQYWQALALGEPPLLTGEQMAEVLARFADYRVD